MKNILIGEQDDAYGTCSDAQIEAVKTRMQIICEKMGLAYRYDSGEKDFPEDLHGETECIFELAMDCIHANDIPPEYAGAVEAANNQCPLPPDQQNMKTKKNALQTLIAAGFDAALTANGIEVRGENWSVHYADKGQDWNEYHGNVPSKVEELAAWDDAATRLD